MKQLTKIKYDAKQIAEMLGISLQRFRNKKEHYINILKQDYYVTIEIGSRNKEFFILEPKENGVTVLKDVAPKTNELKRNDLKNIELILKAVLIDNVLPMPEEISKSIGKSEATVKRHIKKCVITIYCLNQMKKLFKLLINILGKYLNVSESNTAIFIMTIYQVVKELS
ncbi:sigma-70, region 4 family protein [Bacillus anthracis]|nr:hypothetical protein [Bacillus anthracis]AIK58243.1 sigma-70, region 4 family protein [Bacillus anthracis]WIG02501.1 hypothetical protein QN296_25585 [Bacillus anthracis]